MPLDEKVNCALLPAARTTFVFMEGALISLATKMSVMAKTASEKKVDIKFI